MDSSAKGRALTAEANHAHWAMVKAAAEECFEDFIHELEERMEAEERERLAAEEAAAAEGAAGEEAPEEEADGEHEEQTDTDTSEEPDMGAMSQLT